MKPGDVINHHREGTLDVYRNTIMRVYTSVTGRICLDLRAGMPITVHDVIKIVSFECPDCGRVYDRPMQRCASVECQSNRELLKKFRANQYQINVPPVYTGNWTEIDWINEIEMQKGWTNGN